MNYIRNGSSSRNSKKITCISIFLLIALTSMTIFSPQFARATPNLEADVSQFAPIGIYDVFTSNFDSIDYDTTLLLTVNIDLVDINDQSLYYNDTMTESIHAIEVSIVEAGYSQKVNLQPELMMTNTNYTPPFDNPVWEFNTTHIGWDFSINIPDVFSGGYTLRVSIYFLYAALFVFPTDVYSVDFPVTVNGRVIGPATEVENLNALISATPNFIMVAVFSLLSLGLNAVLILTSIILWRKVRRLGVPSE